MLNPGLQGLTFDGEEGQEFSTYTVSLNGPAPGAGYSQLNVNGAVDLAEATLNPLLGCTPTSGEQFTIIKSTAPVTGTFNGLPEGASLTIGNTQFTISYKGDNGGDVVLTAGSTAAPTVSGISPNSGPASGGTLVTITGTGFTGATAVDFGTAAASRVTVVNSTAITADSPPGSGIDNVTVTTGVGTSAVTPADRFTFVADAPTVTSVERFGFHHQPTSLVVFFSAALDAARAANVNNYQIVSLAGRGHSKALAGHLTPVRAAVYDPAKRTVTLYMSKRLSIRSPYRLTVNGAAPFGLTGATGSPHDPKGHGMQGADYVALISGKMLAVPAPGSPASAWKTLAPYLRHAQGSSVLSADSK